MSQPFFSPIRRLLRFTFAAVLALPALSSASPEVPLDHPAYSGLYELQDRGLIPISTLAAIRPVSESDARRLLSAGVKPSEVSQLAPRQDALWIRPAELLRTRVSLANDAPRPFSTPMRPRPIAGALQLSCERQEGRPCGDGGTALLEVDSSAGLGQWLSAFSRLRTAAGGSGDGASLLTIDRLYTNLELGPAELLLGRNVLVIGPGRRTQLLWGTNAPPLDRVSLSVRRLEIPSLPLALGGSYTLGRLDGPQRFPNTLVSIARVHLEIAERLNLGMTNLLALGGEGAPELGIAQFVKEHVHRTGAWPGMGVSNRRLGYDLTLQIPPLRSTFYFEFVFEDWRAQFATALAHDTDYLLGWASSGLGRARRYGFVLELHRTGVRSQEHGLFTSGMTSGGRAVGSPLGPDALSLYVNPHMRVHEQLTLSPWMEVVRLGSDSFAFPDYSAIERVSSGLSELRWRTGVGVLAFAQNGMWVEGGGFAEHVRNDAFGLATRDNFGLSLAFSWRR